MRHAETTAGTLASGVGCEASRALAPQVSQQALLTTDSGDRVQMDTCKVAPGIYQYTAADDCTRYRVLAIYPRRTGANTIEFLEQVLEEMYFPVQRVQTDQGREFFAT